MRRRHSRHQGAHDDTEAALANFALTFAKALLVFCVVMFLMISPESKKTDGIKPKMEYMISIEWPGDKNYDVDTWVQNPDGKTLMFNNREVNFMTLERDNLGYNSNTVEVNGQIVRLPINEELVAVRGIFPGEYVLNLHLFKANGVRGGGQIPVEPIEVKVRIEKLNPSVKLVFRGSVILNRIDQEEHVVRFTLTPEGDMTNITTELPISLIQRQGRQN